MIKTNWIAPDWQEFDRLAKSIVVGWVVASSSKNPPTTISQNEPPAPIRSSIAVVEVVPPTSQVVVEPLAPSVACKSWPVVLVVEWNSIVVVEWNSVVVEWNSIWISVMIGTAIEPWSIKAIPEI